MITLTSAAVYSSDRYDLLRLPSDAVSPRQQRRQLLFVDVGRPESVALHHGDEPLCWSHEPT